MSDELTADDVAAIRARADAATPGPWEVGKTNQSPGTGIWYWIVRNATNKILTIFHAVRQAIVEEQVEANCKFIAAARTDIPRLCDEVTRLREENAELRRRVG